MPGRANRLQFGGLCKLKKLWTLDSEPGISKYGARMP